MGLSEARLMGKCEDDFAVNQEEKKGKTIKLLEGNCRAKLSKAYGKM